MLLQSTRESKQILLLRPQVFIYFASHERSYLEIIGVRSPKTVHQKLQGQGVFSTILRTGSRRIQTIALRNEQVLRISWMCFQRSNDPLCTGNQIFIHSWVVRVMLNAKSSIISIVLHSLPCRVGQGLKHLNNFTRDNLKQFTILSICNIFLFPFYLLWLHDWAQLWPILTMLRGKV